MKNMRKKEEQLIFSLLQGYFCYFFYYKKPAIIIIIKFSQPRPNIPFKGKQGEILFFIILRNKIKQNID